MISARHGLLSFTIVTIMSASPSCTVTGGSSDGVGNHATGPTLCDIAENHALIEGGKAICGSAWAAVYGACITDANCRAQGKTCTKLAGDAAWGCVLPCTGGASTNCPPDETCLRCWDSYPYCVPADETCPEEVYTLPDGNGNICHRSVSECNSSDQCCRTPTGMDSVCAHVKYVSSGGSLGEYCVSTCDTAADCYGGAEASCCLSVAVADCGNLVREIIDGPAQKVCWLREEGGTGVCGGATYNCGNDCGNCGTAGSAGTCCGGIYCGGDCVGSPCC